MSYLEEPHQAEFWDDEPPVDDCGHTECVSQRQITQCLRIPAMVDVPLPLIAFVAGKPAPQGSKKALHHKQSGKIVTMESSKAVKPWRESIRHALLDDQGLPRATFTGAVLIELRFVMPRPASTPKRSTPPAVKRPDIDKLARAVLDAVSSAGVWHDDSQVTQMSAMKRLADLEETPGLHITIRDAP